MAVNGTITGYTSNAQIAARIEWSATQSFASNSSTITATLYYSRTNATGDQTAGYWDGSLTIDGNTNTVENKHIRISYNSNTVAITHTVTVRHNDDGSRNVTISASGLIPSTSLSNTVISGTVTLDAFDRLATLSASDGTLGTAQTLSVVQADSSFPHTITYTCGTASGTVCTKSTNTSISWTPPVSLASQNTAGTSVTVSLTITTYISDEYAGSRTITIKCSIPASVKPSCSIAVSDANGHATKYGAYVQGYSKFKIVTTPTTAYGAKIISTTVTADGTTYNGNTVTSNVVQNAGALTITTTVTDERGRTGTASINVSVLAYTAPAISLLKVNRCNSNGTENPQGDCVMVTFSSSTTTLNSKNSAAYSLQYKKSAATSYSSVDMSGYSGKFSVSNGTKIFAADTGSSYDVLLTVTDNFASTSKSTSASSAFTLMHWMASGKGMGIGKVAEVENALDIGFKTKFTGGILPITLAGGTDLNNVLTTGFYSGYYIPSTTYYNAPIENGHFEMEVSSSHDGAIIYQKFTAVHGNIRVFRRVRYETGTWTAWYCSENDISTLNNNVSTLQSNMSTVQSNIAALQSSVSAAFGKTYADGFVLVEMSNITASETTTASFSLPSGVSDYWIDSAWAISGGNRYSFPVFVSGIQAFGIQITSNQVTVTCYADVTGYSARVVVAYKM